MAGLCVVRHENLIRIEASDAFEFAVGDRFAELGDLFVEAVTGTPASELLDEFLAEYVGGGVNDFVGLARAVQGSAEDRYQILAAAGKFGHTALTIGERELEFHHRV